MTEQGGLISAHRSCSGLGWLAQRLRLRLASSLSLDGFQHTACAHRKPGQDCISQLSLHTGDMLSEPGPAWLTVFFSHHPYRNKGGNPEESPFETTAPGPVGHPSRRGMRIVPPGRGGHDPKSCPEVKGEEEEVKSAECGLCSEVPSLGRARGGFG